MLSDLDETIKALLIRDIPLDIAEIDIAFAAPIREWSASLARPTLNCYLYHLVENHDLRDTHWEFDRSNGYQTTRSGMGLARPGGSRRRAPLRIDTYYMITAWANAPEDEHRLLWRALVALMHHQTLLPEYLFGQLATQTEPLPTRIAQPEVSLKNPADFWNNMDGPLHAGFNYVVTLPLDPDLLGVQVPLVLTRGITTRFTMDAESAERMPLRFGGWVRRGESLSASGVPGVPVLLVERGHQVRTDTEGRFTFDQVPPGRYTLRVDSGPDRAERIIDVPGESYDLVLANQKSNSEGGGANQ